MESAPPRFQPKNPDYRATATETFNQQRAMKTLGISISRLEPGEVDLQMDYSADLTQQHGFLHAGAVTAVVDSACGYTALTLMPPGAGVLSVEFKINLLAPAAGERFRAIGRVVRAGRTLTVCAGEMRAEREGGETVVALMQATMMALREREGLAD